MASGIDPAKDPSADVLKVLYSDDCPSVIGREPNFTSVKNGLIGKGVIKPKEATNITTQHNLTDDQRGSKLVELLDTKINESSDRLKYTKDICAVFESREVNNDFLKRKASEIRSKLKPISTGTSTAASTVLPSQATHRTVSSGIDTTSMKQEDMLPLDLYSCEHEDSIPKQDHSSEKNFVPGRLEDNMDIKHAVSGFEGTKYSELASLNDKEVKTKPVLILFIGTPDSGNTEAVNHILDKNVKLLAETIKIHCCKVTKAESITYRELMATKIKPMTFPSNATEESGYFRSIYSALMQNTDTDIPFSQEITLVNMWEVALNKTAVHFIKALRGHLHNCYPWLFLDLLEDLDKLHLPPELSQTAEKNGAILMKWRPRLHYLLRCCSLAESKPENKRRRVCTLFAKHDGTLTKKSQKNKMDELERKVQAVVNHMGVAPLMGEKLESINLSTEKDDTSLQLNEKLLNVICDTPYKKIPVVWVFLHSYMMYHHKKSYIGKRDFQNYAKKCGMSEKSFEEFCEFYTSFGSIFDLSLIGKQNKYVIIRPMLFLKSLDCIFTPGEEMLQKDRMIKYGFYSEEACDDFLHDDWFSLMGAIVSLNLATKVTSNFIEPPPAEPDIEVKPNTTYYFISSSRNRLSITEKLDTQSIHVITSIDTPHVFSQVSIIRKILENRKFKEAKIVPCENFNQTIISYKDTEIRIVLYSPATRLYVSKPDSEVCAGIATAYKEIAEESEESGITVKYKFVKLCVAYRDKIPNVQSLPSSFYHILPDDDLCPQCKDADCEEDLLQVWNEALRQIKIGENSKPTGDITATELADVAEKIASIIQPPGMDKAPINIIHNVAKTFIDENYEEIIPGELLSRHSDKVINAIILWWYKKQLNKKGEQELRRVFARKVAKLGTNLNGLHISEDRQQELKGEFESMAQELDVYYIP